MTRRAVRAGPIIAAGGGCATTKRQVLANGPA